MAERVSGKAKRASQRVAVAPQGAAGRRAVATPPVGAGEPMTAEQEHDRLKAELEAARSEIAELRQQRDQVVNRIDWIIDSLHVLLEEER